MFNLKSNIIHVLWIITCLLVSSSAAENFTLPLYELEIDVVYLNLLNNDPWNSRTFPAILEFEGEAYECRVRYRGASARNLPKKSWKFFFDNSAPHDREVLNLNSEYRDITLNHNHLTLKLAQAIGLQAPKSRHVSLSVNGNYFGVYLEIENIDEQFFTSRNNPATELYKSRTHASRFAPPLDPNDLTKIYEPKFKEQGSLDTLGRRLAFFYYSPPGINTSELNRIIDVENFLKYFALMFTICNWDGFAKNFYLWRRDDNRYLLIPWDCDGTFGNNWQGNYIGFEGYKNFGPLLEQAVFQHLIAIPQFRERLHEKIEFIVNNGFQIAETYITDTYNLIRHDVYLDPLKRGDNNDFEEEAQNFHRFITDRRINLRGLDWFYRFDVSDLTFTPEYAGNNDSMCKFEVRLAEAPSRALVFILDSAYVEVQRPLNDIGENGDRIAADMIYSTEFFLGDYDLPVSFTVMIESKPGDWFTHPPSGWHLLGNRRFPLPMLNRNDDPPLNGDIQFGDPVIDFAGTFTIPLTNLTDVPKDISSCKISLGSSYRQQTLPQLEELEPGQSLLVTNHLEQAEYFFPDERFIAGFYYAPNEGDTLRLTSPGGNLLAERVVHDIKSFREVPSSVVINEINYQSADDSNSGDWIELFTFQRNMDLSGWRLTDNDPAHVYTFPAETNLQPNSFLVIARYPDSFMRVFPKSTNVIGGFDFGFSNSSDEVKLYNPAGELVDWVSFTSNDPWPDLTIDGGTLELTNSRMANYSAENWHKSGWGFPRGTPGDYNSLYHYDDHHSILLPPADYQLISAWPNPFNDAIYISFAAPEMGAASFKLFNSNGRLVTSFSKAHNRAGFWRARLELTSSTNTSLSAGMYFLRLEGNTTDSNLRLIYLP